MTISVAPMASGGITPAPPLMTVLPTTKTRKKVPMNSQMYLFMGGGAHCALTEQASPGRALTCRSPRRRAHAHADSERHRPLQTSAAAEHAYVGHSDSSRLRS